MRKADLYQEMYDADALAHWSYIRKWACWRYDILPGDLDLLLELHKIGRNRYFTKKDFGDTVTTRWNTSRWERLYNSEQTGRIILAKKRGKRSKYNGYKLDYKTNKMISQLYKYLTGVDKLPKMDKKSKKGYVQYGLKKRIEDLGI